MYQMKEINKYIDFKLNSHLQLWWVNPGQQPSTYTAACSLPPEVGQRSE